MSLLRISAHCMVLGSTTPALFKFQRPHPPGCPWGSFLTLASNNVKAFKDRVVAAVCLPSHTICPRKATNQTSMGLLGPAQQLLP